jgi:hypothetical protein
MSDPLELTLIIVLALLRSSKTSHRRQPVARQRR